MKFMRHAPADSPTVLIFSTGGTIGMHDVGKGFEPDPSFPDLLESRGTDIAQQYGHRARVNQLQPAIDSSNADEETAPKIARAVRARVGTMRARGVVITHGTDTLAYTAARLAFELHDLGVPVVVTGSQRAHGEAGTDAWANLGLAIRTAIHANPNAPVSVAFGGKVIPAVRATKSDTESFSAFRAERQLAKSPVGVPRLHEASAIVRATHARVLSYRFTPAVTAADLLAAASATPDALVLECYGSGNAPMAKRGMADALSEIGSRIPVVAITQCSNGAVDIDRYAVGRQLSASGVTGGSDLTVEAAIAKLGYLLDQGFTREQVLELLPQNLVGECSGGDA